MAGEDGRDSGPGDRQAVDAASLAARAREVAAALDMPDAFDPNPPTPAVDSVLSSLAGVPRPWEVRPGMRLGTVRRLLLRVLAPFTEAQYEMDTRLIAALVLLAGRVSALEAELARARSEREG